MKKLARILAVICGNVLLAFGIAAFLEPTGIISGGTTGIGLFVQEFLGLPVSVTYGVVNVVCFLLGLLILGKEFAMSTLLSTVIFPFILGFFENVSWLSSLTDDYFLAAVLAGTLSGTGVGLVIRFNASTGGMDIPPLIVHKLFGVPIGTMMLLINVGTLALQLTFSDSEQILYGLVQTFIMTMVMDKVLLFGKSQANLMIISPQYERIHRILLENETGVTLFPIETGYTGEKQKAILCVVSSRRLPRIKQLVEAVDPTAFVLVNSSTEVMGRGFTLPRQHRLPDFRPL